MLNGIDALLQKSSLRLRALAPLFLLWAAGAVPAAQAQNVDLSFLQTRAEASGYEQTTRYDEAQAFLKVATGASERLHLSTFGYSKEGRPLPLVVFGAEQATPEAARATGKTRVFVQANIHAGEVAGKEAMLMLVRALAAGRHAAWADSLVVLIAPLYNADGNERIDLYHRPLQLGPVGGMGQRPNAQGLDLNRDHMKLDSPEARSLVRLFRRYDPDVVIDLHTTNGTVHAYHLTYSPPLHPDTPDGIVRLLREAWLPAVTQQINAEHGWNFYYYGNAPPEGATAPLGWYTFDYRPRFSNNYAGLRGRFGILSEAYAYAPFEERVQASLYFTRHLLQYAHDHAAEIRRLTAAADTQSVVGDTLTLRAEHARSAAKTDILLGAVAEEQNPYSGAPMLRRLDSAQAVPMYEYGTFAAMEQTRAPAAYYVPDTLHAALDLLRAHGLRADALERAQTRRVERFRIDSVQVEDEPYQNRRPQTLVGAYEAAEVTLPAGTLVVPVDQPLGRLAVALLEPRAADGVAYWGVLEEPLRPSSFYPIARRPAAQAQGGEAGSVLGGQRR